MVRLFYAVRSLARKCAARPPHHGFGVGRRRTSGAGSGWAETTATPSQRASRATPTGQEYQDAFSWRSQLRSVDAQPLKIIAEENGGHKASRSTTSPRLR